MKLSLRSLVRFFSHSTPRTISLLLFVLVIGSGLSASLPNQVPGPSQRIADVPTPTPAESPNTKHVKVLVIGYYPRDAQNSENLDASVTGENVTIAQKQTFVGNIIDKLKSQLAEATSYHKYKNPNASSYITYSIYDTKNYFEKIPRGYLLDASRGIYRPNYGAILTNQNICNLVDSQGVSEIWMFGYHYSDIEPDESRMSSKYGDISNSLPKETAPDYATYRMPICTKSYVLYNFNYSRDDALLHTRGHQLENVISYIDKKQFWGDFSEYIQSAGACADIVKTDPDLVCHEPPHNYKSSCGNIHFAPNWKNLDDDYDNNLQTNAENNCETWNPDDSKTTYVNSNCNQWGCTDDGFLKWYFQNVPGYNNCIAYQGQNMRNWWDAMYDFNAFIDKRKSLYSAEQNCKLPEPTANPTPTPPVVTPTPTGVASDVTDCGTENQDLPLPPVTPTPVFTRIQCMIGKASTCAPAKITLNQTLDLAPLVDVKISSLSYQDISKNSNNTCNLHIKQGALGFLRYGGTNEQKQAALLELKKREGLEGICIFQNNADVVTYFNKLKSGVLSFSTDPSSDLNMFKNGQCSGPFFDQTSPSPSPTETPGPSPTQSPNASDARVLLDVMLPGIGSDNGIGANTVPIHQTRTFIISFYDKGGKLVGDASGSLVYTGEHGGSSYIGGITVHGIPDGSYTLKVKADNSLYKAIPGVKKLTAGQTTNIPGITLTTGNLDDTNGSKNLLDLSDYNLMLANYGHGNNLDLTLSDLNDDGITDSKDLNILLRGFAIRKGD